MTSQFYPFAKTFDHEVDFEIGPIAQKIGLSAPQALLLNYMLCCELSILVRYTTDEDSEANARLELCVFWDDMVVGYCDLDNLLTRILEAGFLQLKNDQEIEVLEKLKVRIELAIAARKVELP